MIVGKIGINRKDTDEVSFFCDNMENRKKEYKLFSMFGTAK